MSVGSYALGSIKWEIAQNIYKAQKQAFGQTPNAKKLESAITEEFIKPQKLGSTFHMFMPEILRIFSKNTLNDAADGKISGFEYMKANFSAHDPAKLGMYRFLMLDTRSSWIRAQNVEPGKSYSGLVPLILYAHKLLGDVPYSSWDRETLEYVVNPKLCAAMLETTPELTVEEKLELQQLALSSASKPDKAPESAYLLPGLTSTKLGTVSALGRIMILQTWCAHPSKRTQYMVLDPNAWDTMPEPLIQTQIFQQTEDLEHPETSRKSQPLPWDCDGQPPQPTSEYAWE